MQTNVRTAPDRAAITLRPGQVDVLERPVPQPQDGEVLVAVACVSVCGTDAHIWAGDYPSAPPPLVQGHEIAGWVDGRLVAVDPARACGRCHACRVGRSNACVSSSVLGVHADGGLREHIVVPSGRIHPVDGLPPATAALIEPASIALQAVARSRAERGAHALVLGCGPIGLLAIGALAERGVRVAGVDRSGARARRAERFGASAMWVADADDPRRRAEILDWADGEGPSVVIEATGAPAALATAIDLVCSAGTVVAVGISTAEARLPMSVLPYKELDLLGSRNSMDRFPEAAAFIARNRGLAEELITHRFPLERTQEAFALVHAGDAGAGKVVIDVVPS
ncbi:zinc-binding dehydrogenase [Actinomadura rubrisoli]|uniref:2-deoxy-scyllo-inosamine dehydrogenase n=1 Tax=Actinomadura rubrisoli TaxID=2530368 RepID=A0A4R5C932_9ACTN|nr:alcohol dehydrogenase catalytic domain-containing protein [Actinomadura rubrisoli]TDD96308.1 2-deoxy-scyllo-inosamine dehydrogenase [Actinomadura rubrisoli]